MVPSAERKDKSVGEILEEHTIALPDGLEGANISRPGFFRTTALPGDFRDSDLVVFIPAYNRQLRHDGKSLGTFPLLIRDLAEASEREGVGITILISDDSLESEAELNERALEVALDTVPVLQKRIVDAGRRLSKPIIVATQMLESMMEHPQPSRAESSDIANAVFEGADALMLSGETAAGHYPVQAVATMARIIEQAEA